MPPVWRPLVGLVERFICWNPTIERFQGTSENDTIVTIGKQKIRIRCWMILHDVGCFLQSCWITFEQVWISYGQCWIILDNFGLF